MRKYRYCLSFTFVILILNLFPEITSAQLENSNVVLPPLPATAKFSSPKTAYFPVLWHNLSYQATSISRIGKKDLPWIAGGFVSTVFLFSQDASIDRSFRYLKTNNSTIRTWSPRITDFGGPSAFYLVGVTGIAGLVCKDSKLVHTSLLASQALITSGVWVRVIKAISSRPRPSFFYDHSQLPAPQWYQPFKEFDTEKYSAKLYPASAFDAFPSGHTATAFSIATVFAMEYRDRPLIPILAYTGAGLVGISRLSEHAHWASDVLAGGCLGYLCAKQIVRYDRSLNPETSFLPRHKKYSITFSAYPAMGCLNGQVSVML